MQEKMIFKKMPLVMKEIGVVGKNQKNQAQGFKFRGIDDMLNSIYPALIKHGVFMTPECTSESHEIREVVRGNGKAGADKHVTIMMKYHFYAEDGSSVTVGPVPAEGLDSGDKATNKALSAALKYALIQTFSVPTEDMAEADLDSPEILTSKPTESIIKKVAKEESVATAPATTATTTSQETHKTEKPKSTFRKLKEESNGSVW